MKNSTRIYVGHISVLILIIASFPLIEIIKDNINPPNSDQNSGLIVVAETNSGITEFYPEIVVPAEPEIFFDYIEIVNGCGIHWAGNCAAVHTEANSTSSIMTYLRNGVTLKVAKKITATDGSVWYKILFDEWLRYPDRIRGDWYISGEFASEFSDTGQKDFHKTIDTNPTNKKIVVNKTEQKLYAFEGDVLFMETLVSTGRGDTPTPDGNFKVFRKTPSRYMQGPLPDIPKDIYDLPGVPWDLYFTPDGAAMHGTYWHNNFGHTSSHGCVNMPLDKAKELYQWADLGTAVIIEE